MADEPALRRWAGFLALPPNAAARRCGWSGRAPTASGAGPATRPPTRTTIPSAPSWRRSWPRPWPSASRRRGGRRAHLDRRIDEVMAFEKWKAATRPRRVRAAAAAKARSRALSPRRASRRSSDAGPERSGLDPSGSPRGAGSQPVDVAHLAARPRLALAVEPDARVRLAGERRPARRPRRRAGWSSPPGRARAVGPSGQPAMARMCCSNWSTSQPSSVQWPVLCTRGANLVDQQAAVVALEQLDADHARHSRGRSAGGGDALGLRRPAPARPAAGALVRRRMPFSWWFSARG